MRIVLVAALLAACGGPPAPAPSATPAPEPTLPMSDPAEYAIPRISWEAGRAIFERTGLGDPYRTGLPYPVFLAIVKANPRTFGTSLDALADRFGFIARPADPASAELDLREGLPLGMHLTTDPLTGVPFVVTSCALCHAERVRWSGGEATVIGLGNKRVRIHAYDRAFAEITRRPGFTVQKLARLADEAAAERSIAWPEAMRAPLVAASVAALGRRATERRELHARTAADPPGRVAVIESFAFALGQLTGTRVDFAAEVGWAKVPDVIGYRERLTLSWDGSQEGPIDLLVVEADLAAGVRIEWLERHPFQGASLGAYLRQPAARPRFPGPIDAARARRGRDLFVDHCAPCHGSYGDDGRVVAYEEAVIPIEDIGTDPARLLAPTASFERAANDPTLTRGYTRFQRSTGYVPPVLTSVWLRAPYGHAGQWPSLAVMAMSPERRPTRYVANPGALYDLQTVGVAIRDPGAALGPGEYLHDGDRPGFSVAGHAFLAELGGEAADVIEYLKTL